VSVLAVSGLQFDLSTFARQDDRLGVMAALAEFERDLFRERIKSDIAAAKARGKRLGRQPGQRSSGLRQCSCRGDRIDLHHVGSLVDRPCQARTQTARG
jgi:DNA invertase Pin-like site-specific DNA recombinase